MTKGFMEQPQGNDRLFGPRTNLSDVCPRRTFDMKTCKVEDVLDSDEVSAFGKYVSSLLNTIVSNEGQPEWVKGEAIKRMADIAGQMSTIIARKKNDCIRTNLLVFIRKFTECDLRKMMRISNKMPAFSLVLVEKIGEILRFVCWEQ